MSDPPTPSPSDPPSPAPKWDGRYWLQWNGHAWEVMEDQAPPPHSDEARRRRLSTGAIVAIVAVSVLLIAAIGVGAVALLTRESAPPVEVAATQPGIQTVPVNSADNPFTPPVAEDARDVPAVETSRPTEVQGDSVGLFGGSKKINVCDKRQLITFLYRHPDMGRGWADTLDIDYADVRRYVRQSTSAILRSDTLVTNHGWQDGRVTSIVSVLQAGTAVLVDSYGVPVTRCYCGNPLTPAPKWGYEPTYYGPTWKWWTPNSITVITKSITIIEEYVFVNVYDPEETYRVPAGTGNPVPPSNRPTPVPDATVPPEQTPPATEEPTTDPQRTTEPPSQQYSEQDAIDYWHQARARCSDSVFTFEDFGSNYEEWAEPAGAPGRYLFTIQGYPPSGDTLTFTWLVDLNTGALIPQNSLAQQGAQQCGELYISG